MYVLQATVGTPEVVTPLAREQCLLITEYMNV